MRNIVTHLLRLQDCSRQETEASTMACKMSVIFFLVTVFCFESGFPMFRDFLLPMKNIDVRKPYSLKHFPDYYPYIPEQSMYTFPNQFPRVNHPSWYPTYTYAPPSRYYPQCQDMHTCCLCCDTAPVCATSTTTTTTTTTTTPKPITTARPVHKVKCHDDEDKHAHKDKHRSSSSDDKHAGGDKHPSGYDDHYYVDDMHLCGDDKHQQHSKSWKDDFLKGAHSAPWPVSMADGSVNAAPVAFLYGPQEHLFGGMVPYPL